MGEQSGWPVLSRLWPPLPHSRKSEREKAATAIRTSTAYRRTKVRDCDRRSIALRRGDFPSMKGHVNPFAVTAGAVVGACFRPILRWYRRGQRDGHSLAGASHSAGADELLALPRPDTAAAGEHPRRPGLPVVGPPAHDGARGRTLHSKK